MTPVCDLGCCLGIPNYVPVVAAEREFPALLVVWAYHPSKSNYFFEEGSFFFAREREERKRGVFFLPFWCVFVLLGGVFVLFLSFFFPRVSAIFLLGVNFSDPTTPKQGIPALVGG